MIIERIWAGNEGRNFHYLIACEDTGEALAVDPLNWQACLARARELNLQIRQIVNTHEHGDHTGGNAGLAAATGALILAHANAAARIGHVARALAGGDLIRVGRSVELTCLDTPGHTRAHMCLYAPGKPAGGSLRDPPRLFSGDTLFNAGVGNCLHGGDPALLYESFRDCLSRLPDDTHVYPGHEYLARNLGFTLDREPSNAAARALLARCEGQRPDDTPVTTLGEEHSINVFFRLHEPEIIAGLRRIRANLAADPEPRAVFMILRELRNGW